MTDCELVLWALKDRKWHHVIGIMHMCKPGAINWAVRSRISDLNNSKKGYFINSRPGKDGQSEYRLEREPGDTAVEIKFDETGQGSFI